MPLPLHAIPQSASSSGGIARLSTRIASAEKPVGRLVLEAPFTSAVDVGARHYWFMPVRLLMKDRFRSDLRASKITAPVLVVHGENDAIVPITLGERLVCADPGSQAVRAHWRSAHKISARRR